MEGRIGWLVAGPALDGWHGVKRAMDLWSKDCSSEYWDVGLNIYSYIKIITHRILDPGQFRGIFDYT